MSGVNVARDGKVWVRATKCDACLYGPQRIVPGERARQLTTDTRGEDGATFVCHKSEVSDEPQSICRGWWDAFADEDNMLRMAKRMDLIAYVEDS